MWEHELSPKELELVELLKKQELSRAQAVKLGYDITSVFLMKCANHGVLLYEYVPEGTI